MKGAANPVHLASRCTAQFKRIGMPGKSPAVQSLKFYRMHGARGGHKSGHNHPQYQRGGRSHDMVKDPQTDHRVSPRGVRPFGRYKLLVFSIYVVVR